MTPAGNFLASGNPLNAHGARGVLNQSLRRWNALKGDEPKTLPKINSKIKLGKGLPTDGIILREVMRDLPRSIQNRDSWRHNLDHFWISQSECLELLPEKIEAGESKDIEGNFKRKLLQFHVVDQVRGQASPWKKGEIKDSKLKAFVESADDQWIKLNVVGAAKMRKEPSGQQNPYTGNRVSRERGMDLKIAGLATFNRSTQRFEKFDMVAVGERWGTDVFNFRDKDPGPHPIGFAFEMLPADAANRPIPTFSRWANYAGK